MRDKKSSKSLKGTTSINDLQKQINALSAKSSTGSSSADLTDEKHGGDGISITSGKISADVDGTDLEIKSDKIVIKDGGVSFKHLDSSTFTSTYGSGLYYNTSMSKIYVKLVHQEFVGGAASVLVNGEYRSAYSSGSVLRPGSKWTFFEGNPFQMTVISYGLGEISKVSLRGQLEVGTAITIPSGYDSLLWDDILYYFGDATPTSLINTEGDSFKMRPYGPDGSSIWMPVVRRKKNGDYDSILGEVHMMSGTSGASSTYFMRFNVALQAEDRLIFDGVSYWSKHFPA
jgi:hypothetical protein